MFEYYDPARLPEMHLDEQVDYLRAEIAESECEIERLERDREEAVNLGDLPLVEFIDGCLDTDVKRLASIRRLYDEKHLRLVLDGERGEYRPV